MLKNKTNLHIYSERTLYITQYLSLSTYNIIYTDYGIYIIISFIECLKMHTIYSTHAIMV